MSGKRLSTGAWFLAAATAALMARHAGAEIVTYTDRATFEAAISISATVTFNGLAPAGGYAVYPTDSTIGGVAFTRNAGGQESMYPLNGAGWGQGFAAGLEILCLNFISQTATPPVGQTAIGVDVYRLIEPDGAGGWKYGESRYATVTVTFSDSQTTAFTLDWGLAAPDALQSVAKFVGVTSSDPGVTVTSVTFNGSDEANGFKAPAIDNFTYGAFNRDIVTYTERTAFEAAIRSATTVTFSGLAPAGGYSYVPPGATFGGVTFSEGMYPLNGAGWGQGFAAGLAVSALTYAGQTATPPVGQTVFGVDLYRLVEPDGAGGWKYNESRFATVTVTYSDGRTTKFTLDWGLAEPGALQSAVKFVGVTSSDPGVTVATVVFSGNDLANGFKAPVIDNFTYGVLNDIFTTYTDRAAFEAAIINRSAKVTFDGLAPAGGYAICPTDSTFGGVAFTRNAAEQESMYLLNGAGWGQGFASGLELVVLNGVGQTATPPALQTAVGVDVYRLVESDGAGGWKYGESQYATVAVTFSNGKTRTFNLDWGVTAPGADQAAVKFVGATSSDPDVKVTSVVFNGSDEAHGFKGAAIDNFTYGKLPYPFRGTFISLH